MRFPSHGNRRPRYGFYAWPYFALVTILGVGGAALVFACIVASGRLSITGVVMTVLGSYLALAHYLSVKLHDRKGDALVKELLGFFAPTSRKKVLDVGSGTGRIAITVARNSSNDRVVGIDVYSRRTLSGNSPKRACENAQIEGVLERVSFNHGDALYIPFRSESFDAATAGSVLHLFPETKRKYAMKEMLRVLKGGGKLILVEWLRTTKAVLLYLLPAFFVFQTEKYWKTLLKEHGLRDIKIARIGNLALISGEKALSAICQ